MPWRALKTRRHLVLNTFRYTINITETNENKEDRHPASAKSKQLEKVKISAASPVEAARPDNRSRLVDFNDEAHSAPVYQISAQCTAELQ